MKNRFVKFLLLTSLVMVGCDQSSSSYSNSSSVNSSNSNSSLSSSSKLTPITVKETWTPSMSVEAKADSLIKLMSVKQKIGQMMQVEKNNASYLEIKNNFLGSLLSGGGSLPSAGNQYNAWATMYNGFQNAAMSNSLQIPLIYGIDAVHGNNNVQNATIFPHNIGLGAANNPELMYDIGATTASEMVPLGHYWSFAPTIASVQDIKWGRSYESYSEDPKLVEALSVPYIQGLQDGGVAATAKHYLLDGFTQGGKDQGSASLDENLVRELFLPSYQKAVEAGVKTIMVSYSSLNGVKMHGNSYWVQEVLKDELGFKGIVVSDYNGIYQLGGTLYSQVVESINAGVDMMMIANGSWLPQTWQQVFDSIWSAYDNDDITIERINDAVKRILMVKLDLGLFEEYSVDATVNESIFRSTEHLAIARQAVQESLVLLKNESVLPLSKDQDILLLGPGRDNIGIQTGGWTISWQGESKQDLTAGTSILEAFQQASTGEVYTSVNDASKADVAVVVIGERPYAEYEGDNDTLSLTSQTALPGNLEALNEAYQTGLPVVVVMIAGRPLILNDEIDQWDAFVMAWLPGTEGLGITDVLYGDKLFKGKLPVTWPKTIDQSSHSVIMEAYGEDAYLPANYQFPFGYGLTY